MFILTLVLITIPGNGAFNSAYNIKQFVTMQGTTRIGENVCGYCPSLTSLTLADSVINIGFGAFSMTPELSCIFWAGPVGIYVGSDSVRSKAICVTTGNTTLLP